MTTHKSVLKYLWISVVLFVTYLLLGSFIISKNILELGYLVILYLFITISFISKRK